MQRVQVFRCVICGEPCIGFERPTNCTFCGAHEKYLVPSSDWKQTNRVELTSDSRKNLEASLELEVENAEFYLCASRASGDEDIRAMLKALSRAETEHASAISRVLGAEKPAIEFRKGKCPTDEAAILEEADKRETRAVRLYTEFLRQATEPRVKELFTALIEIESDHIDLVNKEISHPEEPSGEKNGRPEDVNLDEDDRDLFDAYRLHED